MTIATIGHNGGPDLEGTKQSLRTIWAKALFADPTTPVYVMAIAWAIHWYSQADGTGAALSNEQLQAICGISKDTAIRGKKWLLKWGYVELKVGKVGVDKTKFRMTLPSVAATQEEDRGSTQRPLGSHTASSPTAEGSHTATLGGSTQPPQGSQTDTPRGRTQRPYIQERDSVSIQEKRALRGRQEDRVNFWQEALNPESSDVVFNNGKLHLLNGARTFWLSRFDGDEGRLDLALIEIAPALQPNGQRPLQVQVEGRLARIVADRMDRDTRYAKAIKKKAEPEPGVSKHDKRLAMAAEIAEQVASEKAGRRT